MKKLILILALLFPLTTVAMCENEEQYYNTAVNLYINIHKIHEINKQLFEMKKLSVEEMKKSFERMKKGVILVFKAQKIYTECQSRTIV